MHHEIGGDFEANKVKRSPAKAKVLAAGIEKVRVSGIRTVDQFFNRFPIPHIVAKLDVDDAESAQRQTLNGWLVSAGDDERLLHRRHGKIERILEQLNDGLDERIVKPEQLLGLLSPEVQAETLDHDALWAFLGEAGDNEEAERELIAVLYTFLLAAEDLSVKDDVYHAFDLETEILPHTDPEDLKRWAIAATLKGRKGLPFTSGDLQEIITPAKLAACTTVARHWEVLNAIAFKLGILKEGEVVMAEPEVISNPPAAEAEADDDDGESVADDDLEEVGDDKGDPRPKA